MRKQTDRQTDRYTETNKQKVEITAVREYRAIKRNCKKKQREREK